MLWGLVSFWRKYLYFLLTAVYIGDNIEYIYYVVELLIIEYIYYRIFQCPY